MSGLTDYTANNLLNWVTGRRVQPALPAVWLALFTAVGADAGTGFTEVSATGTAYARLQVAGSVATSAATSVGSAVLTFAAVPSWIVAGMQVYDATAAAAIPAGTTVVSATATTVTLSANVASPGVGNGDSINFSAFGAPSGSAPSMITTTAALNFQTATGTGFGTILAFGLYDAATAGNLITWDYIGNYPWLPATVTAANPGVITAKAHGYNAADSVVWTNEYGGTAPTFSTSNFTGVLAVASPTTDTFTVTNGGTGVATSSTGGGSIRKIIQQQVPTGVQAYFPAGSIVLTSA